MVHPPVTGPWHPRKQHSCHGLWGTPAEFVPSENTARLKLLCSLSLPCF